MTNLLIVVDMLNDFADKTGVLAKSLITGEFYGADIVESVRARVTAYRNAYLPIIWLCDAHAEDDKEFDRFPKHAVKGTWGAQILDMLFTEDDKLSGRELTILKTRYSGFYGTDLEYQLGRLAPRNIEVIGVCTSICVMDTVGGLANRDYDTHVWKSAVADFDPAAHEAALGRMEGLYGAKIV